MEGFKIKWEKKLNIKRGQIRSRRKRQGETERVKQANICFPIVSETNHERMNAYTHARTQARRRAHRYTNMMTHRI